MPVSLRYIRGKWRVVERGTRTIAKNKGGTPIDGGGHQGRDKAHAQVGAVNSSHRRRGRN